MITTAILLLMLHADAGVPMPPKTVTLKGTAQNAKGGAVLIVDGAPVYVKGRDAWPKDKLGTQVTVTGTLRDEKHLPSPVKGPKGEISQGAEATQLTLEPSKE